MDPKDYENNPADDIDLDQEIVYLANGERMTNAKAQDMADAAERRAANLIPGGKSLSGNGRHSPVVQTRIPAVVHAKLQAIADTQHVSMSKIMRAAIDEFIKHHENQALDA